MLDVASGKCRSRESETPRLRSVEKASQLMSRSRCAAAAHSGVVGAVGEARCRIGCNDAEALVGARSFSGANVRVHAAAASAHLRGLWGVKNCVELE